MILLQSTSGTHCFGQSDLVKERLKETLPRRMETREEFISRLHLAVAWVNRYRSARLWELSTNQKERATECLNTEPPGGRTSF